MFQYTIVVNPNTPNEEAFQIEARSIGEAFDWISNESDYEPLIDSATVTFDGRV